MATPGEAAVRAVKAGIDVILDSPDSVAAFAALKAAVESGRDPARAARGVGAPHPRGEGAARPAPRARGQLSSRCRCRSAAAGMQAVARQISERAITLIKDEREQRAAPAAAGCAACCICRCSTTRRGWRIAAPSRTVIPALQARWPTTEAVEMSDRTTPNELELVRAMAAQLRRHRRRRVRARVVGQRPPRSGAAGGEAAAGSGARGASARTQPFVAVFFGNPYMPMFVPEVPAMLLTYDFSDHAEASAVRALAGEIPIGGRLPISNPRSRVRRPWADTVERSTGVQSTGVQSTGVQSTGVQSTGVQSTRGSKHEGFKARGFKARGFESTGGSKHGGSKHGGSKHGGSKHEGLSRGFKARGFKARRFKARRFKARRFEARRFEAR